MVQLSKEQIIKAATNSNLILSEEQATALANGQSVDIKDIQAARFVGCGGIKIADLGGGCGLYYNPPFGVSVCCEG